MPRRQERRGVSFPASALFRGRGGLMSLLFHNHENHRDYEAEDEHTKQQAEDYLIRGDGLVFVEDDADDGVQRNVGQIEAHERGDGDSHAVHLRVHAHR